ncbi:MAG: MarR family transcriptional regulator [Bacteroidota bacterium]
MRLEEEINQPRFKSHYQKAHLNILFTAAWLNQNTAQVLKAFNISGQQFNILRILRGRHPEPATVKLLTERMIDKMSNASRLVEKLKQKGLVERHACPEDRRRVDIVITERGMQTVNEASRALEDGERALNQQLSPEEAKLLSDLLDKLRG